MSIVKKPFGKLPDGREATLYELVNAAGARVGVTDFGGRIVKIVVPDKNGAMTDVALGYADVSGYFPNIGYIGALIGRVGNRICKGECPLGGKTLHLNANAGGHHLHGGNVGFDQKLWDVQADEAGNRLTLTTVSPDGEENYPGTLRVKVTYTFTEDDELSIRYEAVCDKDTLVNLTNHAYFNLSGEGSGDVKNHEMTIHADAFTAADEGLIPTGELRPVAGTVFDLRKPLRIADGLRGLENDIQMQSGKGYDHNFVLRGAGVKEAAVVYAPDTGIEMRVFTDQPGVQFYGGNCLEGVNPGKCGRAYAPMAGLCLETQRFPDAPNHDNFPSILLKAGEKYDTTTTYAFGVKKA